MSDFRTNNEESYYDFDFDRELIVQSISKQYHILPSEQEELHFSDWYQLVAGLMNDTPLGQIVQIRSEKDKDIIKHYGNFEKRIRREWREFCSRQKEKVSEKSKLEIANYFDKLFESMFGGDKK